MDPSLDDTVELPVEGGFSDSFFTDPLPSLAVEFGAATHCGLVRSNNEDQFAVIRRSRSTEVLSTSLIGKGLKGSAESTHTLVVADGVGGSKSGEVASRIALETVLQLTTMATSWVMRIKDLDAQQIQLRVDAYVQRVQQRLRQLSRIDSKLFGMGTTWTSASLFSRSAVVVHIGDSRAYVRHDGALVQITRDETIAQAMIDSGASPNDAARFRHILTNSFGGRHEDVSAQIHHIPFGPGDRLLLCTDGLYDEVKDDAIAEELRQSSGPQAICEALVQRALDAGGKDNVTVVMADA